MSPSLEAANGEIARAWGSCRSPAHRCTLAHINRGAAGVSMEDPIAGQTGRFGTRQFHTAWTARTHTL